MQVYIVSDLKLNRVHFISLGLTWGNICRKREMSAKITSIVRHFADISLLKHKFPHIKHKLMK